jgi:integrase
MAVIDAASSNDLVELSFLKTSSATEEDGEPRRNPSSRMAVIRRRLGFPWTTHDLRHLFAIKYLEAHEPYSKKALYRLQQIMGHSSITTTELYLDYLTADEQKQAKYGPAQKPAQI